MPKISRRTLIGPRRKGRRKGRAAVATKRAKVINYTETNSDDDDALKDVIVNTQDSNNATEEKVEVGNDKEEEEVDNDEEEKVGNDDDNYEEVESSDTTVDSYPEKQTVEVHNPALDLESRRVAIAYHFEYVLGAPEESKWAAERVVSKIRNALAMVRGTDIKTTLQIYLRVKAKGGIYRGKTNGKGNSGRKPKQLEEHQDVPPP